MPSLPTAVNCRFADSPSFSKMTEGLTDNDFTSLCITFTLIFLLTILLLSLLNILTVSSESPTLFFDSIYPNSYVSIKSSFDDAYFMKISLSASFS